MINLLKQALETVLNHKQMGKLSPSDFNTSLAKNVWNIYVNIFADMRTCIVTGKQIGRASCRERV